MVLWMYNLSADGPFSDFRSRRSWLLAQLQQFAGGLNRLGAKGNGVGKVGAIRVESALTARRSLQAIESARPKISLPRSCLHRIALAAVARARTRFSDASLPMV
jgi:hypothetical protein